MALGDLLFPPRRTGDDSRDLIQLFDWLREFYDQTSQSISLSAATSTREEEDEWRDLAAGLDPRCYRFPIGNEINITVPAGKVYYVSGAFLLDSIGANAAGAFTSWFHRNPDFRNAYPVGPGTVLQRYQHDGLGDTAGLYYYDPSFVIAIDKRYEKPRQLYYERLRRLKNLTTYRVGARVEDAVDMTDPADITRPIDAFDAEHLKSTFGIVVHTSCMNGAWTALTGSSADGTFIGLNLNDEISDLHSQRFTTNCMVPFVMKKPSALGFDGMALKSGNSAGTLGFTDAINWGVVDYKLIPEDF